MLTLSEETSMDPEVCPGGHPDAGGLQGWIADLPHKLQAKEAPAFFKYLVEYKYQESPSSSGCLVVSFPPTSTLECVQFSSYHRKIVQNTQISDHILLSIKAFFQ